MNPDNMKKRILMSVIGVVVSGISVGMFKFAALGVDPFQTFMAGTDALLPIRFGTLYVIVNGLLLLFAIVSDRKKIGIATLINLFLLGYIAEYTQYIMRQRLLQPGYPVRFGILAFAVVILCLATSLYFTADLGVSPYDALALIWSQRQNKLPFAACRVIGDLASVLIGTLFCVAAGFGLQQVLEVVGIGTVITAFFMGPLIEFFNVHVARPLLNR